MTDCECEKPSVLVYGEWRGLYGGACLQTGWLLPDSAANTKYYGKELTMREILVDGQAEPTEAAKSLVSKIEQYSKPR
jgi:lipid-binding SYLF domain-containing protein